MMQGVVCSGDDYQPLNLDLATQEWLTAGGVRRVCAGHLSLEMFKPLIVWWMLGLQAFTLLLLKSATQVSAFCNLTSNIDVALMMSMKLAQNCQGLMVMRPWFFGTRQGLFSDLPKCKVYPKLVVVAHRLCTSSIESLKKPKHGEWRNLKFIICQKVKFCSRRWWSLLLTSLMQTLCLGCFFLGWPLGQCLVSEHPWPRCLGQPKWFQIRWFAKCFWRRRPGCRVLLVLVS